MFSVVFFISCGGDMTGGRKTARLKADSVIIVLELDAPTTW